jgi:O-antigen ligase
LDPRREGRSAHNLYLEIFAEMGILGLIWLFALQFVTFSGLRRAAKRFASSNHSDLATIPTAMMISIVGLLLTSIFLHMVYPRYFWMAYAVAFGIPNAAEKEMNRAFITSKWKAVQGIFHVGEQHA